MRKFNNNSLFYFLTGAGILFLFFIFSFPVFATTIINEDITSNTTWDIGGSPYVIENSINVSEGITLTVDPGVIIKLNDASINIFGDLIANGELGNEIYFTSYFDDSVGGDTNDDYSCYEDFDEDGNSLGEVCYSLFEPTRYDWQGLNFFNSHNNYIKNTVIMHIILRILIIPICL